MANKLYEESNIQAIANAIRAKGQTGTMTVAQMPSKIAAIQAGITPTMNSYTQENGAAHDYIANVDYSNDPSYSRTDIPTYKDRSTTYRKDQPAGCDVQTSAGTLVVTDGNANKSVSKAVSAGANTVYNVTPNGNGGAYVVNNNGIKNVGKLSPTGKLRMIFAGDVTNMRDLGGWNCDGGTVKYGRLFRGGQLRDASTTYLSDEHKKTFLDLLGIKSEVNYQVQSEGGGTTPSPLGDGILYYSIPIAYKVASMNYDSIVDMYGTLYTGFRDNLKQLIYNATHNIPTYFHCTHGADRTGTTAWFLEHLLGMSDSDCDKDYELTTFDATAGNRWRKDARYTALINHMKTCSNGSLKDCAVAWCVKNGITIDEINAFRTAMINGAPSALTANVNNAAKAITANQSSVTVNAGESAQVSVKVLPFWATSSITWSTSDATKATVSVNGKTATITGVGGGNVTITATSNGLSATFAVTVVGVGPSYTDQIPISTDANGNVYNGIGYKNGVYLASSDSATEESNANTFTTGFIPAHNGDVLRCTFDGVVTGGAKVRIFSYNSSKGKLSYKVLTTTGAWTSVESGKGTLNLTGSNFPATMAYIRICLPGTGDKSDLTINEEIE